MTDKEKLSVKSTEEKKTEKLLEVDLSDGTKGLIRGDTAYRKNQDGSITKLGAVLDDQSIMPEPEEDENDEG